MADQDDGSIPNDSRLLRRVHPDQVVLDKNTNLNRPSSGAFDDDELSVDAEHFLLGLGLDWGFSIAGYNGYSLAVFNAGFARERKLPVLHKPLEGNQAHAEVHGKKTPSIARALAKASQWVHLEKSDAK